MENVYERIIRVVGKALVDDRAAIESFEHTGGRWLEFAEPLRRNIPKLEEIIEFARAELEKEPGHG